MKRFESLGGKRLGHERSLDVAAQDLRDQRAGGARDELEPYLDLKMRLGEGTGSALCIGLVKAATKILGEMATFKSAGVTERSL